MLPAMLETPVREGELAALEEQAAGCQRDGCRHELPEREDDGAHGGYRSS